LRVGARGWLTIAPIENSENAPRIFALQGRACKADRFGRRRAVNEGPRSEDGPNLESRRVGAFFASAPEELVKAAFAAARGVEFRPSLHGRRISIRGLLVVPPASFSSDLKYVGIFTRDVLDCQLPWSSILDQMMAQPVAPNDPSFPL
jgi:hypothetical protein